MSSPAVRPSGELLFSSGEQVDHFRVVRLLGKGGFGEVYLARDSRLGRRVALKVIHPRHLGSEEAVQRFLFEARATARFSHPHIVTIYAVGEYRGMPYVALEYLEGSTLRQRLRDDRPSKRETLRLGLAIAEALAEAHAAQILHRDLKPENILIPKDGRLRVLDFGLAKKLGGGSTAAELDLRAPDVAPEIATAPTEAMPRNSLGSDTPGDQQELAPPSALETVPPAGEPTDTLPLTESTSPLTESTPVDPEDIANHDTVASGSHSEVAERTPDDADTVDYFALRGFDTSAVSGVRGTPFYMAPEQWAGSKLSGAVDVWALGVMLHEMLTGRFPFKKNKALAVGHEVCSRQPLTLALDGAEFTRELIELVKACLSKDATKRPLATRIVEILGEQLSPGHAELVEEQGPFRGLLPFGEQHAGLYFGREAELAAFLEQLRAEPTIAVVGPSGAGKSSFVAAGIAPRLRERGPLVLLRLRPGPQPFAALAARLKSGEQLSGMISRDVATPAPADEIAALAAELEESPPRLGLMLRQIAEHQKAPVLLFVDQLEELYALVDDPERRQRFMQALGSAAEDPLDPVRTIVTLRDDFLGRIAAGEAARRVLSRVVVLRSPDHSALDAILRRSVAAFGYDYSDEKIVAEMIASIKDEPACLPLVSFAGRMLWERRDRDKRLLTRSAYEQMGGVVGALASHADAVIKGLSGTQPVAARELLLRLVTAEGTRRTVSRQALLGGLLEAEAELVLGRLTEARLITVGRGSQAEAQLELAHEALIESWALLARWIDESQEERVFLAEVEQAAELWRRRGQRDEEVWRGVALEDAQRWKARSSSAVPTLVCEFLAAGKRLEGEREAARMRRRALVRAAIGSGVTVVLILIAVWALTWRQQAEKARAARDDAVRQLVRAHCEGAALALRQGEHQKARALLRSALEHGLSKSGALSATVARELRLTAWQLDLEPLLWDRQLRGSRGRQVVFSPDGRQVLVLLDKLYALDATTGIPIEIVAPQKLTSLGFSPDGRWLACGGRGRIDLLPWPPTRAGQRRTLRAGVDKPVYKPVFGTRRIFARVGNRILSWDLDTGKLGAATKKALQWPRGLRISGGKLTFFDGLRELRFHRGLDDAAPRSWQRPARLQAYARLVSNDDVLIYGHGMPPHALTFERDWSRPGATRRVDVALQRIKVQSLALDRRGKLLALGTRDRIVELWDARRALELAKAVFPSPRENHVGRSVVSVSFSRGGRRLAALTFSGRVIVWRVAALLLRRSSGHRGRISAVAVHPAGTQIVSTSYDKTVRTWDPRSGRTRQIIAVDRRISALDYSRDGRFYAGAGDKGVIYLWRGGSGQFVKALRGHQGDVRTIAFDRQTKRLASASPSDGTVRVWSLQRPTSRTFELGGQPRALSWQPDGQKLAVGFARRSAVWLLDVKSGKHVEQLLRRLQHVVALRYDDDGHLLARLNTGTLLVDGVIARHGRSRIYFGTKLTGDRKGRSFYDLVATPHVAAATLRLFDRKTRHTARLVGSHRSPVSAAEQDEAGTLLATGSISGALRVFPGSKSPALGFTPLLALNPPRVLTRQGIRSMISEEPLRPRHAWERAVIDRGWLSQLSPSGKTLCTVGRDFKLELWDTPTDRRLLQAQLGRLLDVDRHGAGIRSSTFFARELATLDGACLVFAQDRLLLLHPGKKPKRILTNVASLTQTARVLAVTRDNKIFRIDTRGRTSRAGTVDEAVAVFDLGSQFAVASRRVSLRAKGPAGAKAQPRLLTRARGTATVLATPAKTWLVGTLAGRLEVFRADPPRSLLRLQLNGPLLHAALDKGMLYVATELGDTRVIDMQALYISRCALLRRLWKQVPLAWENGELVPKAAPKSHPCFRSPVAAARSLEQTFGAIVRADSPHSGG